MVCSYYSSNSHCETRDGFRRTAMILYITSVAALLVICLPILTYCFLAFREEIQQVIRLFFQIAKSEISFLRVYTKKSPSDHNNQQASTHGTAVGGGASVFSDPSQQTEVTGKQNEQTPDSVQRRELHGMFTSTIVFLAVFVVFSIAFLCIGIYTYTQSMNAMLVGANNYIFATRVADSALSSHVWAQELFSPSPYPVDSVPANNPKALKSRIFKYINNLVQDFDNLLYGDVSSEMDPLLLTGLPVIQNYVGAKVNVAVTSTGYPPINGFLHDVYFSMSCESQLRLIQNVAAYIFDPDFTLYPYSYVYKTNPNPNDIEVFPFHFEHVLYCHMDHYFTIGTEELYQETIGLGNQQGSQQFILFIFVFMFQFMFIFFIFMPHFFTLLTHRKTATSLLLLVNPDAIIKSQAVTKWLSGSKNMKRAKHSGANDAQTKTAIALDFIVNSSKCGLFLTDLDLKITESNTACSTFFKRPPDQASFIGQNLRELFTSSIVDKDKGKFFKSFDSEIYKMTKGTSGRQKLNLETSILASNGQVLFISVIITAHSNSESDDETEKKPPASHFSFVINDRTAEHFQDALVESEKSKSEKLVTSLLPPSIVKRMNEGEREISFTVQIATVLFTSVVGWNDIIAKMSAEEVVSFLNRLYSAYDEELANFPAITKLKTIGHIYMLAAGLFNDSSVNSAQVMVTYALRLLDIVQRIVEETKLQFSITCGINTGGPINCGILGRTRPVFDILGDVVNVSSRMNSSSLPGYIQISEGTYETIKFLNFFIRERGEIQVKGKGLMKTYLVSNSQIGTLKGNSAVSLVV